MTKEKFTANDIKTLIKENDVQFIQLQFVDINGLVKNLTIPSEHIDKILENDMMLDGSSIKGFRKIETSDMCLWPDKDTFQILPWQQYNGKKTARLICDIYNPDGTPFVGCPRCNLKRVIKEAENLGLSMNMGPEMEFFLFNKNENGEITTKTYDKAGYYEAYPEDKGEMIRADIVDTLQKMEFDVEASHHENADGQHEIDFKYADILTSADNVSTFKIVVKAVASKYNLHATFMPKPVFGMNGSGMHCNISLSKEGKNAFFDPNTQTKLSQLAEYSVGGILKNIRSMTAILNPTVNSYKRLVPGYEAPVYMAWALSNRSALLRVPCKRGVSTRVELRSPDPSCNPYLAFAVILYSCIDGIQNEIVPPSPVEMNIYNLTEKERKKMKIDNLPRDLEEALHYLSKNETIKHALGEHIFNEFMEAKEREWKAFRGHISNWEINKYLSMY